MPFSERNLEPVDENGNNENNLAPTLLVRIVGAPANQPIRIKIIFTYEGYPNEANRELLSPK